MGRNLDRSFALLAALFLAGVGLAGAGLAWARLATQPDPRVALAVDWQRFELLALDTGVPPMTAARALRPLGVGGLVVRETTLEHLRRLGAVHVEWGWEWQARRRATGQPAGPPGLAGRLLVRPAEPELAAWLEEALERRWPYGKPAAVTLDGAAWFSLPAPAPAGPDPGLGDAGAPPEGWRQAPGPLALSAWTEGAGTLGRLAGGYPVAALTAPLGFYPGHLAELAGLGFALYPRLQGHPLSATPADLGGLGGFPAGTVVLLGGDALPADRLALGLAARRLESAGLRLGTLWQEPATGLDLLAAAGLPLVKAHPFWPGQRLEDAVAAVRERQARLIVYDGFEHLPGDPAAGDPAGRALPALARALRAAGYGPGQPPGVAARGLPAWAVAALAPAVWATAGLAVLVALPGVKRRWSLPVLALVAGGATAGLTLAVGDPGVRFLVRELLALVAAVAVPAFATLGALAPGAGGSWWPWRRLLLATGLSLSGGLLVAALLADPVYVAQVRQFRGVRLALLAPAAIAGLAVLARSGLLARRDLLARPVSHLGALAALGLAGALALAGFRAGNFPVVGVTEWELRARGTLEHWLLVRPRTKEFLAGHPALVLAAGSRWTPPAAAALAVLAGLGQASVLNTLAHVHIPLGISLVRVVNGLVLGALTGWAALTGWRLLRSRFRAAEGGTSGGRPVR